MYKAFFNASDFKAKQFRNVHFVKQNTFKKISDGNRVVTDHIYSRQERSWFSGSNTDVHWLRELRRTIRRYAIHFDVR